MKKSNDITEVYEQFHLESDQQVSQLLFSSRDGREIVLTQEEIGEFFHDISA